MKLIVLKNNFRDGLNAVEKAVTENSNLPILKNILLKTFNNKIQLSGTNLEIAITKYISGKIIEEGSITVPLSALSNITNNINNEKINLEVKDHNLLFKTDNYEATIQGLPEEEFPIIPKIENAKNYLKIDTELLKESLLKIINTIQYSEIRPEIGGVLFDFQVNSLKLVGTDSFRLAEKTIAENNFQSNFPRGFKIIVPLKTAQEFLRISNSGETNIFIDSNQILFKNGELEVISRLIEGNYPDYEQIIPKSFETEVVVEREHLLNDAKLVGAFSGKVNDIKLYSKDGKKIVELYSSNQYLGENKYLVPAKIKVEEFQLTFNWRYLMDGLKNLEDQEVFWGINGDKRGSVFKSLNDQSYFYILMPVNST